MTRAYAAGIACLTALACTRGEAPQTADSARAANPVVTATPVYGGYGMSTEIRWVLSPDGRAILAVVDPVSVEADALPDGFFFGSESPAFSVQVDSVWDVAPAPDWQAVAFSRAFVTSGGEQDSVVSPAAWEAISRRTAIDTATLRSSSFSTSGMSYARGVAQPSVIFVPADPRAAGAAEQSQPRSFPIARGWRLRWSTDGKTLALGASPARTQDDEPSTSWTALDPRSGAVHGSMPSGTSMRETRWMRGPVIDISVALDLTDAPTITVKRGEFSYLIESQRGVITIRDPANESRAAISIGPGKALAATSAGRYILALAPRTKAMLNEPTVEAVVYTVTF